MSTEIPQIYNNLILSLAAQNQVAANATHLSLNLRQFGITANVINGVILEEFMDRNESAYDNFSQLAGDLYSYQENTSHLSIRAAFENLRNNPSIRLNIDSVLEKRGKTIMGRGLDAANDNGTFSREMRMCGYMLTHILTQYFTMFTRLKIYIILALSVL